MVNISEVSNDELRQEIERRKIAFTKPKPIDYTPADIIKLQELCASEIESHAGQIFQRCRILYL